MLLFFPLFVRFYPVFFVFVFRLFRIFVTVFFATYLLLLSSALLKQCSGAIVRFYDSSSLFCSRGVGCSFSWGSLSPSPSAFGATLKRICSLGEQILSFMNNSQIWSDTADTIKVKNKNDFFNLTGDMENCKMSGKNQGLYIHFSILYHAGSRPHLVQNQVNGCLHRDCSH